MKIAIVYTGRKGGGNLYTLLIARAVKKSGFEVKLFLSGKMDNLHEFHAEGFDIEVVDTFKGGMGDVFCFPFRVLRLASCIRQYKPDIIYSTMFNPYITFIELLCPGKKIYTFHNYTAVKRPIDHIIDFFQVLSIRFATHVIALSSYFDDMVKKRFPCKKTFVIPLPTFRYQGEETALNYGKEFGSYLLFTGRMTEKYKGLEVIENAFEIVNKKNSELKLVIAGRGADAGAKESDNDGRVIRLGKWLSDEEFNGLVRNSFLVIVPYVQPNPSAVAAAATALGVPVVASNFPCLNEQVFEGKNGVLFEPGNAEQLAAVILRLAKQETEYRKLKAGVEAVATQFDIERLQPEIKRMLEIVGSE
jgi:glycosyltransferase involved in cell wall biosynthesis